MEINGVNSQSTHAHPLGKLHPKEKQEPEPANQASAEQESNTEQTTETSDAKGVIRLLQEGHFKGTSDVRLRINFYEEIAAIDAAKLQEVAEEKVDEILQSVGTIIDSINPPGDPPPVSNAELPPVDADGDGIIDTYGLPNTALVPAGETTEEQPDEVTQLQDTFTQTITQLKEDFLAAQTPSTDTLLEGIQSAFDQLVESLQSALAPPEEPAEPLPNTALPNTAPNVPPLSNADAAPEPAPETPSLIDELTAAYEASMEELINGFDSVNILPPISEPKGNGRAHQKFLDIYNQMRDATDQT
ncbi:MAG: hypothetical protein ACYS32_15365 [Planctomycetota bacterium]|jgi:hypothetical protein